MKSLQVSQYSPNSENLLCADLSCFKASDYLLRPFDSRTIDFLDTLSKNILADKAINRRSEITALGFWLRNVGSNLIFSEDLWWEKPQECEPFGFNEKTFLTLHYVDEELMYKYNKKYNLNE